MSEMEPIINENILTSRCGKALIVEPTKQSVNNKKCSSLKATLDQYISPTTGQLDQQQLNQSKPSINRNLSAQNIRQVKEQLLQERLTLQKSHKCGSFYANCNCISAPEIRIHDSGGLYGLPNPYTCDNNNYIGISRSISESAKPTGSSIDRPKSLKITTGQSSYIHPDTTFVFTDENRTQPLNGTECRRRYQKHAKHTIKTKNGRVELSKPKRLSSPNIGNYAIVDVAIHPEVVLNVSHVNSGSTGNEISERTPTKPPQLIDSNASDIQTGIEDSALSNATTILDRIDSPAASYSFLTGEIKPTNRLVNTNSPVPPVHQHSPDSDTENDYFDTVSNILPRTDILNGLHINSLTYLQLSSTADVVDPARKYFLESGILGPMGNASSNILKKSSKIMPISDPIKIEQIRRNSKVIMRQASERKRSDGTGENFGCSPIASDSPKIRTLEDEVLRLKDTIKSRDNEITKLKREIHKLKSVLQQTALHLQDNNLNKNEDLLSSLQTHHGMAGKQNISGGVQSIHHDGTVNAINHQPSNPQDSNKQHLLQRATTLSAAVKKQGVSGESSDATGQLSSNILIRKYEKDFRSKQLIKDAIMDNDFLKHIDSSQIRELVDSMYSREVSAGEYVIREGDAGAHLFVSAEGEFEVIKDGTVLGRMGPGKAFGELAILYNCTRTASIRVLCTSHVWVLDRRVFQQIMMRTGMQKIEENVSFLKSVPLLQNLSKDLLAKIADVLEVEFYPASAYIIRQGASGDTFFLISQGSVKVTQRLPGSTIDEDIRELGRGDYFGEQALIKEDKRTANIIALSPGVECLTLDRESFTQLIGDLCELHEKDYGDESRVLAMKSTENIQFGTDCKQELLDIDLDDLDVIATLGVGGFGRVELVRCEKDRLKGTQTFALKCLKKQHIVDTRQEEHVFSERTIMLACRSPFICRLYRTYRDNKYVYMLLEACMGGEVWTILRDRGRFDDATTQFITGCVLQAFEYLHMRGIVYRDLKPENLMLDDRGYVKLVDFGFGKYIGYSSKTWTFCGTPEYVAPEIILNKGHDRAVDYWALGVLIHELLTGTPPFAASDPMKTYNIILKGIDMVNFPKYMSRSAITLIKKLCRDVPAERLGYQRGGIQDIKKHKWFQGFDWDGLASQQLQPFLQQPISGPMDTCNFDDFPIDIEIPPDEMSGWDKDF